MEGSMASVPEVLVTENKWDTVTAVWNIVIEILVKFENNLEHFKQPMHKGSISCIREIHKLSEAWQQSHGYNLSP